jgi:hypothetical protein
MKRRALLAILTALSGLCLLMLPGTASAATQPGPPAGLPSAGPAGGPVTINSLPPQFADYLFCFNGHVFTDFTDPDGDDAKLSVTMAVYRPIVGDWTYHQMTNTGPSAHGVFFWLKLSDHGIDPGTVSWYAFAAIDEAGDWWGWKYADSRCQVLP